MGIKRFIKKMGLSTTQLNTLEVFEAVIKFATEGFGLADRLGDKNQSQEFKNAITKCVFGIMDEMNGHNGSKGRDMLIEYIGKKSDDIYNLKPKQQTWNWINYNSNIIADFACLSSNCWILATLVYGSGTDGEANVRKMKNEREGYRKLAMKLAMLIDDREGLKKLDYFLNTCLDAPSFSDAEHNAVHIKQKENLYNEETQATKEIHQEAPAQ